MEPEGSLPHSQVPAANIPLLNFHVSSFHHIFVCILSLASVRSMKRDYYIVAFEVMSVGFFRRVSTEDKTAGPVVRSYSKNRICC